MWSFYGAMRFGNIAQRDEKDVGVAVFRSGGEIFRDNLFAIEIIRSLKGHKWS